MDALSPSARLAARDDGVRLHAVDRALLLLSLDGDEPVDALAALPLGIRDRRLLARRAATFGDGIDCLADCPDCGITQEFRLSAAGLAAALATPAEAEIVVLDGVAVTLRALTSLDLAAAARCADGAAAAALLVERAILDIDGTGAEPGAGRALPSAVRAAVEARVEAREAAAELALALTCDACGTAWTAAFDAAACFFAEIESDARRLIGEVTALAERFGWSEAEILAMPPSRRRAYLEAGRP